MSEGPTDELAGTGIAATGLAEAGSAEAHEQAGFPSEEQALDALRHVTDPELGINIVDLGLVYRVDLNPEAGSIHVEFSLTTMGCPIGPLIEHQIQQELTGFSDVKQVEAELVLRPAWSPEMMSEEAKAALGFF